MASVAYTLHNVFPISPGAERERLSHRESTNHAFIDLDEQLETPQRIGEGHNEFEGIIGSSKTLRAVLDQVRTVASAGSTVLIEGETGTGKEMIAQAVHMKSQRRSRPFVKLNCAAIPLDLLESELFGHERGAFTGAVTQRVGRFEAANGGTLFLDEIGDIPLELQSKLLRVLQEQEFERLGGTYTHRVDVRIVAATNRDLADLVEEKRFRMDLYYRLNVFPFPYIANTLGWMTAELGRQPWLIYGLFHTRDGYSKVVSSGDTIFTLIGFTGLYFVLGVLFLYLTGREIGRGPDGPEEDVVGIGLGPGEEVVASV